LEIMDFLLSIFPIIFIFLIFYLLVIRPQTKTESRRREFIANLKRGEIVVLSSGIVGKVIEIQPKTVLLEVSKDVKIKVLKDAIQGPFIEVPPQESKTKEDKKEKEKEKSEKEKLEK
jgi:preprotein translocase subunit YajC